MAQHTIKQRMPRATIGDIGSKCTHGITVELSYSPSDPYQVNLILHGDSGSKTTWVMSRHVLRKGLGQAAGGAVMPGGERRGDVVVQPYVPESDGDPVRVCVLLRSDDGEAEVRFNARDAQAFLDHTYRLVPRGKESDRINLDACIRGIFVSQGKGWDCPIQPQGSDPDPVRADGDPDWPGAGE